MTHAASIDIADLKVKAVEFERGTVVEKTPEFSRSSLWDFTSQINSQEASWDLNFNQNRCGLVNQFEDQLESRFERQFTELNSVLHVILENSVESGCLAEADVNHNAEEFGRLYQVDSNVEDNLKWAPVAQTLPLCELQHTHLIRIHC